jgi:hypothetical protein
MLMTNTQEIQDGLEILQRMAVNELTGEIKTTRKRTDYKKKPHGPNSMVEVGDIFERIQDYCNEKDICQRDFCRNAGLRETWLCEFVQHCFKFIRQRTLDKVLYGLSLSSPVRKKTKWGKGEGTLRNFTWLSADVAQDFRRMLKSDRRRTIKRRCKEEGVPYHVVCRITSNAKHGRGSWVKNEWMEIIRWWY